MKPTIKHQKALKGQKRPASGRKPNRLLNSAEGDDGLPSPLSANPAASQAIAGQGQSGLVFHRAPDPAPVEGSKPMTETQTVPVAVKPWYHSKTVWTQIIAAIASIGAIYGLELTAEEQVGLVLAVQLVANAVTAGIKTLTKPSVTPTAAGV